jgi:hypothetical protein
VHHPDGHEPREIETGGEKLGAITVVGVRLRRFVVGGVDVGRVGWVVVAGVGATVCSGTYSGV